MGTAKQPAADEVWAAEVIIIGAGIVGGLMAYRLASAGMKVLVLDSGPEIDRATAVKRFHDNPAGSINSAYVDPPYAPTPPDEKTWLFYGQNVRHGVSPLVQMNFQGLYLRGVGGTSWHFTGHAERFQPNDFRMKTAYGHGFDWPISYDDLEPYYEQAEKEWGVAGGPDTIAPPRKAGYPMPEVPISWLDREIAKAAGPLGWPVAAYPHARNSVPGYDGRPQCCGSSSCRYICPVHAKYDGSVHVAKARAAGAWVLSDRVVNELVVGDGGDIERIRFRKADGSTGEATGKLFILAAHAIETPKLLMMSTGRSSRGVANSSGMVGRNLMCNVDVDTTGYSQDPVWPYRAPVFATGGVTGLRDGPFRSRHAAAATFIVNGGFSKTHRGPTNEVQSGLDSKLIGTALRNWVHDRSARQVHLSSSVEVLPHHDNVVEPDWSRRDAIGLPMPKVRFHIDEYTLAGCAAAQERDRSILEAMKCGEIAPKPEDDVKPEVDYAIIGGTTRMGHDPRGSVVDARCRSHDHKNLFVIGTSVYPTITICSPSLTAAALAIRAADTIINTRLAG